MPDDLSASLPADPPSAPLQDPLLGRTLGDFVVRERLGQGGLGAVYRVEQESLGREAVIKVLHPGNRGSRDVTQRFLRESRLASKLDHPYAAHIYAFGAEPDGLLWIAMELVRGTTLSEELATAGPLPPRRVSQLVDRLAEVIQTAHDQGIVHRDLKPSNVMLLSRAGRLLPKLLDFGLAKPLILDAPPQGRPLPELVLPPPSAGPAPEQVDRAQLSGAPTPVLPAPVILLTPPTPAPPVPPPIVPVHYFKDPRRRPSRATIDESRLSASGAEPAGAPTPRQPTEPAHGTITLDALRLTPHGFYIGTPQYMAPEQWSGHDEPDPRSDLYALGVLCFEALTGRLPYERDDLPSLKVAHVTAQVPRLSDAFPEALNDVLQRALAKRPEDRYQTALEFAAALRDATGASDEPAVLPRVDDAVRTLVLFQGPQPLADALTVFEGARSGTQAFRAAAALYELILRWLGTLALAARARVGSGEGKDSPAVEALLRTLVQPEPPPRVWLELARDLCRPFARRRAAHPVPELVGFFYEPGSEKLAHAAALLDGLGMLVRDPPDSEETSLLRLEALVPDLSRVLGALSFLAEYPLAVPSHGRAELWVGFRRALRPAMQLRGETLGDDQPTLISRDGASVLSLHPLVQRLAPTPGAPEELFIFQGWGARGARLLAPPMGFERFDGGLKAWLETNIAPLQPDGPAGHEADRPPYQGLSAFSVEDAENFFGREREAEAFANRMRVQPLLAVVGPSGVGKSSFVQAGVLPLLGARWRSVVVRPGPSPLAALGALLLNAGVELADPRRTLERDPAALGRRIVAALPEGQGFVLVVDQFEEVVTLCHDASERALYAEALVRAATHAAERVRVVLTLRDDFLLRVQRLPALRERIGQGLQLLSTPLLEDLVRTLVEPARRAGYGFEDPELPRKMALEVSEQPGALAILSFTAAKLWELRDRTLQRLTRKAYLALGGVGGALAQHAESTLAQMAPAEQKLTREVFRHLVSAEGTRAVLTRAEVEQVLGGGPAALSVLESLIRARLLVASEGAGAADRVEVVHEALLSSWPRLVEWQRADAESARMRDQLRAAARQWNDRGRVRGVLWRGEALTEYRVWRSRYVGTLTEAEEAFAQQSLKEAARGRILRNAAIGFIFAALTFGLAVVGWSNARAAQRLRELHAERGRTAMLDGRPLQAYVSLTRAFQDGVRGAGVRHLLGKAARIVAAERGSLEGHSDRLFSAELSPDRTRLITSSADGTARLWNATTGQPQLTLHPRGGPVRAADWQPDGARVVTASGKGVQLWNAADGSQGPTFEGHTLDVWTAAFSPDGQWLATGGDDQTARLWNAQTGEQRAVLPVGDGTVGRVRFSPDGKLLVTYSGPVLELGGTQVVRVWEVATGKLVAALREGAPPFYDVAFSPQGDRLAVASSDRVVRLYDLPSGNLTLSLEGHWGAVTSLAWRFDGAQLASASADRTVRQWDAHSGKVLAVLAGHEGAVRSVAFRADGTELLTGGDDAKARIWDAATGKPLMTYIGHTDSIRKVAFEERADLLVSVSPGDLTVKLWDARARPYRSAAVDGPPASWARFSRDGQRYFTAGARGLGIWNTQTGKLIETLQFEGGVTNYPAFDPTEKELVTELDGELSLGVFSLHDKHPHRKLVGHTAPIEHLDFSRDGTRVVSAGRDSSARIWDPARGAALMTLAHPAPVHVSVFSPTGSTVVTGSADGLSRLWDASTGKLLRTFTGQQGIVCGGDITADGRYLVTGSTDHTARLWDLATGAPIATLQGHLASVNSAFFSPDGGLVATSSHDGTARLWDARSGALLDQFEIGEPVASANFSPDGSLLGTVTLRGAVSFWDIKPEGRSPAELASAVECRIPYQLRGEQLVLAGPERPRCNP